MAAFLNCSAQLRDSIEKDRRTPVAPIAAGLMAMQIKPVIQATR
jgi:hypothetical protein